MNNYFLLFFCFNLLIKCLCQTEIGDQCSFDDGRQGICARVANCSFAEGMIQNRVFPKVCSFKGTDPIVCCAIGEKSQQKCADYNKVQNVFDLNTHGFLHEPRGIEGGKDSKPKEFPHMALLGFGNTTKVEWVCGGSLLSDKFILTAAHCIYSRAFGFISIVRLGELDINSLTELADPTDYDVLKHHVHPSYNSANHYHDIALLELKNHVQFDSYKRPACLYTERIISPLTQMLVTGWGDTEFGGEKSPHLQNAELSLYSYEECKAKFSLTGNHRQLPRGIDDDIQFCAGGRDEIRDTCPGDSGGPLQTIDNNFTENKVYSIIGITSFGKACGGRNNPGVYVRIYRYIPWIESIVWP